MDAIAVVAVITVNFRLQSASLSCRLLLRFRVGDYCEYDADTASGTMQGGQILSVEECIP